MSDIVLCNHCLNVSGNQEGCYCDQLPLHQSQSTVSRKRKRTLADADIEPLVCPSPPKRPNYTLPSQQRKRKYIEDSDNESDEESPEPPRKRRRFNKNYNRNSTHKQPSNREIIFNLFGLEIEDSNDESDDDNDNDVAPSYPLISDHSHLIDDGDDDDSDPDDDLEYIPSNKLQKVSDKQEVSDEDHDEEEKQIIEIPPEFNSLEPFYDDNTTNDNAKNDKEDDVLHLSNDTVPIQDDGNLHHTNNSTERRIRNIMLEADNTIAAIYQKTQEQRQPESDDPRHSLAFNNNIEELTQVSSSNDSKDSDDNRRDIISDSCSRTSQSTSSSNHRRHRRSHSKHHKRHRRHRGSKRDRKYNQSNPVISAAFIKFYITDLLVPELKVNKDEFQHIVYWEGAGRIEGFGQLKNKGQRYTHIRQNVFGINDENIQCVVESYGKTMQRLEYKNPEFESSKDQFQEFGSPTFLLASDIAKNQMQDYVERLVKNGLRRKQDFISQHLKLANHYLKFFELCVQKYNHLDAVEENKQVIKDIEDHWESWYDDALELVNQQNRRQILWIYGQQGNEGKSKLCQWFEAKYEKTAQHMTGKSPKHLASMIETQSNLFLIDLPRTTVLDEKMYGFIEELKNGKINVEHYEARTIRLKKSTIVVFANDPPDSFRWSQDRYVIREIVDQNLMERRSFQSEVSAINNVDDY